MEMKTMLFLKIMNLTQKDGADVKLGGNDSKAEQCNNFYDGLQ